MAPRNDGKGADGKGRRGGTTIVLRREEVVAGGHHGGAWKVAYADFVTAMMAFFLLMWLLNATTEEQRKGLADYFSPQNLFAHATSGSGKPFGGKTPYDDGALVSDRGAAQVTVGNAEPVPDADFQDTSTVAQPDRTQDGGSGQDETYGAGAGGGQGQPTRPLGAAPSEAQLAQAEAKHEQQQFDAAALALRSAVAADPALAGLDQQLKVDSTPDGLRIQIMDQDHRPMFATGSSEPDDQARLLLQKVAPVLNRLTETIAITGHTDAAQYHAGGGATDRGNWELSADRANATRRLLVEAGLPEARVRSVSGDADRDPLLPSDPMAAANRRIAIVVLRDRRMP